METSKKKKKRLVDSLLLVGMLVLMFCSGFGFGHAYSNLKINSALLHNEVFLCNPGKNPDASLSNWSNDPTVWLNTQNITEFMEMDRIRRDWIECREFMAFGEE